VALAYLPVTLLWYNHQIQMSSSPSPRTVLCQRSVHSDQKPFLNYDICEDMRRHDIALLNDQPGEERGAMTSLTLHNRCLLGLAQPSNGESQSGTDSRKLLFRAKAEKRIKHTPKIL